MKNLKKIFNKKFIFCLVFIFFILILSCEFLFLDIPPIVKIIYPQNQVKITENKLQVSYLIYSKNEYTSKVRIWIEGTDIEYIQYNLGNGNYIINFDLSSLPFGLYDVCAEGYNSKNEKGEVSKQKFVYNDIIKNSNFSIYSDNWGLYENDTHLSYLNNRSSGDWLYGWEFYIFNEFALDNKPEIILNGNSIRYRSTQNDGDGNAKFQATQYLNYKVSSRTKFYIKFKILSFSGGTNPIEAPIKIGYKFKDNTEVRTIASYSNLAGTIEPPTIVSSLTLDQIYEYSFYLSSLNSFIQDGILEYIFFWVNGHYWDAVIYEFKLFED